MKLKHEYKYIDDDTVEFIINSRKYGEFKVLLDAKNIDRILQHRWTLHGGHTNWCKYATNNKVGTMHRLILNTPKDMYTDHINGNGLDNRESNLRICTPAENSRNAKAGPNNTSGFKGVSYMQPTKKMTASTLLKPWIASIQSQRKNTTIGLYATKEAAALAYDAVAKVKFKEFAYLNFPDGPSDEVLKIIKEGEERVKAQRASKYTSGYTGVYRIKDRWYTQFDYNSKKRYIGAYATEEEAASAWDKEALFHRGTNAKLNLPEKLETYLLELKERKE